MTHPPEPIPDIEAAASRGLAGGGVETLVAADGLVRLRSTRRPEKIAIIDPDEWADFLAGVKNGDFDPPPTGDAT